jgi:hypothetical protein
MSHAETILQTLDRHLTIPVPLILYGRAALALGFNPPLPAAALSLDVDVILTVAQSAELDNCPAFWEALDAANTELQNAGLYLTHLFEESQVILRPEWKEHLAALPLSGLKKLQLFRPHALDLLLTKMMRGADPQDMEDAGFIIRSASLTQRDVETAIRQARLPEVSEIRDAFARAVPLILEMTPPHVD